MTEKQNKPPIQSSNPFLPNSFQCPNVYVDLFMPLLTPEEMKVLIYFIRAILGWEDKRLTREACISLSQIEQGARLSREAVIKCLTALERYKIIASVAKNDPKTNNGNRYHLETDKDKIDITGLEQREVERTNTFKARTVKARDKNKNNQIKVVSPTDQSVPLTARSQSDRPRLVSPTDGGVVSPTDTINPSINPSINPILNPPVGLAAEAAREEKPKSNGKALAEETKRKIAAKLGDKPKSSALSYEQHLLRGELISWHRTRFGSDPLPCDIRNIGILVGKGATLELSVEVYEEQLSNPKWSSPSWNTVLMGYDAAKVRQSGDVRPPVTAQSAKRNGTQNVLRDAMAKAQAEEQQKEGKDGKQNGSH